MTKSTKSDLFPKSITHYTLVEVLHDLAPRSAYHFALYEDSNKKKYLCKLWTGEHKDQNYTWIVNEIAVYKSFSSVYKKHSTEITTTFPEINIPQMVHQELSDTKAFLLTEYIEGSILDYESQNKKSEVLLRVIQYFNLLSPFLKKEPHNIMKLGIFPLFVRFHYYLLKVVLSGVINLKSIIKMIIPFYLGLPELLKNQDSIFVHRDLGFADNVLLKNQQIFIIDFQLSVLTNPLMEIANVTVATWQEKEFRENFLSSNYIQNLLSSRSARKQYKALVIYAFLVSTSLGIEKGQFKGNLNKITKFSHSL